MIYYLCELKTYMGVVRWPTALLFWLAPKWPHINNVLKFDYKNQPNRLLAINQ